MKPTGFSQSLVLCYPAKVSLFLPLNISLTIYLLRLWSLLVGHTSPGLGSLFWQGATRKVLLVLRLHDPTLLASIRQLGPQTQPKCQGCCARDGSRSPRSSVLSDCRGMRNQKEKKRSQRIVSVNNKEKKKYYTGKGTPMCVRYSIYLPLSDEGPKKSPALLSHPSLPEFSNVLQVESPAL